MRHVSEAMMANVYKDDQGDGGDFARAAGLLGGRATFRHGVANALAVHDLILAGFPGAALTRLVSSVPILQRPDVLERAVGISQRTLQRRKGEATAKALSPEQSGRAWKFAEVLAQAISVFGSQEEAERWLERPAIGLDQHRPIDLLATPAGTELVEQHLERIAFGVYA